MVNRWRFTAPQTDTRNVARISGVTFRFGAGANVSIEYEICHDVGDGVLVVKDRRSIEMDQPLPAPVETLLTNINTRALAFLVARGILPDGTEEAPPAP